MATGQKWSAQTAATAFESGDIMSIVQSGTNKSLDYDILDAQLMANTQICKAWVTFDGTGTVAIIGDYNVSSITDNGTGDYSVNYTSALDDALYSVSGSAGGTSTEVVFCTRNAVTAQTTALVRISTRLLSSGNLFDDAFIAVMVI